MHFAEQIIYYLIILLIIVIGLIVSYEDLKTDKIRNKWIKLGFLIGAALNLLLIIIFFVTGESIDWNYYLFLLLNTLIAFILGFTLWLLKIWTGGDAKFFTLYAFLIPLFYYSQFYFKYFPSVVLLINIIIPIFVYLLIKMLVYPFQLLINYIKNPGLLKEYYQKYKQDKKIDKIKIKEIINTAISFIIILILFQLLRTKLRDFLNVYLGTLMIIFYFFLGFVIFRPLRAFLQKRTFLVAALLIAYFIFGILYFREQVFVDLHKIFALQFILMMSYFYIFKYGKSLGSFLYNSAEVKIIPIGNLHAGQYVSKGHLKKVLDDSGDIVQFKEEMKEVLDEEENQQLWDLIKTKIEYNDKRQFKILGFFRYLRLNALPSLVKKIYSYRQEKKLQEELLDKVNKKLNNQQKKDLEHILSNDNEIKKFLKTIRGKLTHEQAEEIKEMIKKRNEKVSEQGHPPIEHIILHKTFAYAPFILLGVIITLLTKSSIIHLILQYILQR